MASEKLSDFSSSLVPHSASSSNGNLTEAAEGIVKNKGELFASFDVDAFEVPGGRDELWRFTPLKRLRGLHDGSALASGSAAITVTERPGVTVETVGTR